MNDEFYKTTKYRILFKEHEQALKERFEKDCLFVSKGHFVTLNESKIAYLHSSNSEKYLIDDNGKPTKISSTDYATEVYELACKRYASNLKKLETCRSIEDLEKVQYE